MSRPLHFLESTDSIRSGASVVDGEISLPNPAQQEQTAQVLVEALLNFALGRDIVISQSYALDSYACQQLVLFVSEAEKQVKNDDARFWMERARPLRMHLFGVKSFAEAGSRVFSGIGESGRGAWVSSLYPDLQGQESARAIAGRFSPDLKNPLSGLQDYRGDLFETTWDYFRNASVSGPRLVVKPTPGVGHRWPSLDEALGRVVSGSRSAAETEDDSIATRTRSALTRLRDSSRSEAPFRRRSLLHGDEPWDGSPGSPSARQICGADITLVREVVDTIYNRIVVNSIGCASASYTTRIGPTQEVVEEALAQGLAIGASNPLDVGVDTGQDPAAPFEFVVEAGAPATRPVRTLVERDRVVSAFSEILRMREEPTWTTSLRKLEASRLGNSDDRQSALDSHVKLVARTLSDTATVRQAPSGGIGVILRGVLGVGSAVATSANPWMSALAGGVVGAAPQLHSAAKDKYRSYTIRRALGQMMAAPRNP